MLLVAHAIALTLAILFPAAGLAATIQGRVVGISDGDTITVLTPAKESLRVRLAEIDAPEARQAYGTAAKTELSNLAFGKPASVEVVDIDRYGRLVGRVKVGALDVNAEMIRRGSAWAYTRYVRDPRIPALERDARRRQVGLWRLQPDQRQPPWDYRRGQRRRETKQ